MSDKHSEQGSAQNIAEASLPNALRKLLGPATVRAWKALAPILPSELYLGGGTAVAVHLRHRESRDLDFFFHKRAVDLNKLSTELGEAGTFAVTHESAGTLRGLFGETKVEFFHADEIRPQHLLETPRLVARARWRVRPFEQFACDPLAAGDFACDGVGALVSRDRQAHQRAQQHDQRLGRPGDEVRVDHAQNSGHRADDRG